MSRGEPRPLTMSIIHGRYYPSFVRYSAYTSLQIQRSQAAQANQQYFQTMSAVGDAFMTASTNLATGMAQLAAQAAVKTAQDAATAAQAASTTTGNTVDLSSILNTGDTTDNTGNTVDLSSLFNSVDTTA